MVIKRPLAEFHLRRTGILALLDRARLLLNDGYDAGWPPLSDIRAQLAADMQDFQTYEHREIFDPIIALDRAHSPIAEELKDDCVRLGNEYLMFRQTWEKADVYPRWSEYRLSAILMMTKIRKRLAEQDSIVRRIATSQRRYAVRRQSYRVEPPSPASHDPERQLQPPHIVEQAGSQSIMHRHPLSPGPSDTFERSVEGNPPTVDFASEADGTIDAPASLIWENGRNPLPTT